MNATEFNKILDTVKDFEGVKSTIRSVVTSKNPTYISLYIHHLYRIELRKLKLDILIDPLIELGSSKSLVYILPYIHVYQRERVMEAIVANKSVSFVVEGVIRANIKDPSIYMAYIEMNGSNDDKEAISEYIKNK